MSVGGATVKLIATTIALGVANGLAAAFVVDGNIIAVIGAIVATVGLTLAVAQWIDKRIDVKIVNHEARERIQHISVLHQISELRVALGRTPVDVPKVMKEEEGDH
jgi:uncharacterized membrane protein